MMAFVEQKDGVQFCKMLIIWQKDDVQLKLTILDG